MPLKLFNNNVLFCVCALFLLVGCSSHIPKSESIEIVGLQNISSQNSINIINDQKNKEEILIGNYGLGSLRGDLHSWTDSAVKTLKDSIGEKGTTISDNAQKSMKVKIFEAKVDTAGIPMVASLARCKILISVETGEGYSQRYEATNKALNPPWACDSAMTSVMRSLLQDQVILDYLKK